MFATLLAPLTSTFAAISCSKTTFFGLVPWYQYLELKMKTITDASGVTSTFCEIQNFNALGANSSFLLIGLAIVDDLLRISAMVAVGFVIYGGIQYITSQGSPDSTKKAQQTVINALIGLVIALFATALVSYLGRRIGGL